MDFKNKIKTLLELNEKKLDDSHPVEYYDAKEHESKAKWHYDRVGKNKGASLKKAVHYDFQAELLKRGVKDSNGKQLPLRKVDEGTLNKYGILDKYFLNREINKQIKQHEDEYENAKRPSEKNLARFQANKMKKFKKSINETNNLTVKE